MNVRLQVTPLLIVEDEDLVADTMHRWLTNLGYPVSHARTAEEALALTKSGHPGVAICDVGLPGQHDGMWLVDQLRHDYPDVAVVLATGRDLPASAVRRDGVVSCLLKPFGRDQLREAVTSAVQWHEEAAAGRDLGLQLERAARECRLDLRRRLQSARIESEADARAALKKVFLDPAGLEAGARVAALADAIADHFAMPVLDREALHWAARFRGLCRQVLPDAITRKPSPLSAVEVAIVRRAPSDVFEVLLDHPFLSPAGYLLRSLREREDGRGHPDGLAGAAIPLGSRILAVVDAIEAITHDQPHRQGRSPADTVLELLRCAGTQFDAEVVHAGAQVIASAGAFYGDPR